jgi:CHASE3 domain sensor protein
MSQQEAEKRVNETFNQLQANADKARKASAAAALWLFISLLIGAFVASFSATFGGRQRDD